MKVLFIKLFLVVHVVFEGVYYKILIGFTDVKFVFVIGIVLCTYCSCINSVVTQGLLRV